MFGILTLWFDFFNPHLWQLLMQKQILQFNLCYFLIEILEKTLKYHKLLQNELFVHQTNIAVFVLEIAF